jgi:hypothetical protein
LLVAEERFIHAVNAASGSSSSSNVVRLRCFRDVSFGLLRCVVCRRRWQHDPKKHIQTSKIHVFIDTWRLLPKVIAIRGNTLKVFKAGTTTITLLTIFIQTGTLILPWESVLRYPQWNESQFKLMEDWIWSPKYLCSSVIVFEWLYW